MVKNKPLLARFSW